MRMRDAERSFGLAYLAIIGLLLGPYAWGATYLVTDSGDNPLNKTLRWAMTQANANPGADTITFDLGLPPGNIIQPLSALPALDDGSGATTINGSLGVVLDGSLAGGPNIIGLQINSDNNVIDGVNIRNFTGAGIRISGRDNLVKRCLIGHGDGVAAPNGHFGIALLGENNIIGPSNVISGNGGAGIVIMSSAPGCRIVGNVIGLDSGAAYAIGNDGPGIMVNMANKTVIGGEEEGNVISGNTGEGIVVMNVSSGQLHIAANIIGAAKDGETPIGNGSHGIVFDESSGTIGGAGALGNRIMANIGSGIYLEESFDVIIQGNTIGAGDSAKAPQGNTLHGIHLYGAHDIIIGGDAPSGGLGNVISGNAQHGVLIDGLSTNNQLIGNRIGVNAAGDAAVPNGGCGVLSEASRTMIDYDPDGFGARNIISGNTECGVFIHSLGADNNRIFGAFIGVAEDGATMLPNGDYGVKVWGASQALIGEDEKGNIISGNGSGGILLLETANAWVFGNIIGVDYNGASAVPNGGHGIDVSESNAVIGNGTGDRYNVISGNAGWGVRIAGAGSASSVLFSNIIGVNLFRTDAIPNEEGGVLLEAGANGINVGGAWPGDGNLISGNAGAGLAIRDTATQNIMLEANLIGVQGDGISPLPNASVGVMITEEASQITVGGTVAEAQNTIAHHTVGVYLDATADHAAILRNSIFANGIKGIHMDPGANNDIAAPVITGFEPITGTAPPGALVHLYVDDGNQGRDFLTSATADGSGDFEIVIDMSPHLGRKLTAIATDLVENRSSAFSVPFDIAYDPLLIVTDPGPVGPGTLYDAIVQANLMPGPNTIEFDFSKSVTTITLTSPLPDLNDPTGGTHIDGKGLLILDGSGIPWEAEGLLLMSADNTVKGMTIVNFGASGVRIHGDNNRVVGCRIGNDGTTAMPNAIGVYIYSGGGSQIGGACAADRNIISGNTNSGVQINDSAAPDNMIQGNYIGLDSTGEIVLPNEYCGIWTRSPGQMIGGPAPGAGNVIASNVSTQVLISTESTIVQGNFIGVDKDGENAMTELYDSGVWIGAAANIIGGVNPGEGNLISGCWYGISMTSINAHDNAVQGNRIGTNAAGLAAIPNRSGGVRIGESAHDNLIGGAVPGARNIISGNTSNGIFILDTALLGNAIQGNYIGLDITGEDALPNTSYGIDIQSAGNLIGGGAPGEGNVIAANGNMQIHIFGASATDNVIQGNYIGVDKDGQNAVAEVSDMGIRIAAPQNTIGGAGPGEGNLISGCQYGVTIDGSNAHDNVMIGNKIGTDPSGAFAIPNRSSGIAIWNAAQNNRIGGSNPGERNLIAGNVVWGIRIFGEHTTGNIIQGNCIGVNSAGTAPIIGETTSYGIMVEDLASDVLIGGNGPGEGNLIAFNTTGVRVVAASSGVTISRNLIWGNSSKGITIDAGANDDIAPPVITGIGSVTGTAGPGAVVEVFADEGIQGRLFVGSVAADGAGNFFLDVDVTPYAGTNLTATQTDAAGNSSAFSSAFPVPGESPDEFHSADQNQNNLISLSELLRLIQFFNSAGYHCADTPESTEDGFVPGANPAQQGCAPHASDYNPQNWLISLSELLRLIQFYNAGGYYHCPLEGSEDGYCAGPMP